MYICKGLPPLETSIQHLYRLNWSRSPDSSFPSQFKTSVFTEYRKGRVIRDSKKHETVVTTGQQSIILEPNGKMNEQ